VAYHLSGAGASDSLPANGQTETLEGTVYESGLEVTNSIIVDKPIGASTMPKEEHVMSALCIGEKVQSFKQLALRSKQTTRNVGFVPSNPFAVDQFVHLTWLAEQKIDNVGGTGITVLRGSENYQMDFYSYVGSLFANQRGGVIITVDNTSNTAPLYLGAFCDHYANVGSKTYCEYELVAKVNPGLTERIYIPPYSNSYCTYAEIGGAFPEAQINSRGDLSSQSGYSDVRFHVQNANLGTNAAALVHRSAADDTQFGGFTGVPYMRFREQWVNTTFDKSRQIGLFPLS